MITNTHVENSRSLKRLFEGANDEFNERRNSNEHSADNVMCWIFSGTWSAEESDVVEFCHTLVCRADGEPSLHPKESIDPFDTRLPLSNPPKYR